MQPLDNSQFTEEQRAEAYRQAHMVQVVRQTKILESIRTILVVLAAMFVLGAIIWVSAALG